MPQRVRIATDAASLTVYENRIEEAVFDYFSRFADTKTANNPAALAEFIRKQSQNRWGACMLRVRKRIFPDSSIFGMEPYYPAPYGGLNSCGAYNPELLYGVYDIYISLCIEYDKAPTPFNFARLTGIDIQTLREWHNETRGDELSRSRKEFSKMLFENHEQSLSDFLTDGKRNPVALLGVLNHSYGWNMPGVSREIGRRASRTVDELPTFGNVHNALTDSATADSA